MNTKKNRDNTIIWIEKEKQSLETKIRGWRRRLTVEDHEETAFNFNHGHS